jgi:membrane-associated protein
MTAQSLHAAADVLALNPLNPRSLLQSLGEFGLWAVIFAETGLLIGFFLPGDTVLFLAGIASSPVATALVGTKLDIVPLLIVTPIAAIAGAQLGFYLGLKYGVKMFDRPNSRVFKREYVEKTEQVFNRFGASKAVVLGRFIPIVRTFLNPAAAVLEMPAKRFLLLGHSLAKQITNHIPPDKIDNYLLPVIVLIVLIAALPLIIDLVRKQRAKRHVSAHRR